MKGYSSSSVTLAYCCRSACLSLFSSTDTSFCFTTIWACFSIRLAMACTSADGHNWWERSERGIPVNIRAVAIKKCKFGRKYLDLSNVTTLAYTDTFWCVLNLSWLPSSNERPPICLDWKVWQNVFMEKHWSLIRHMTGETTLVHIPSVLSFVTAALAQDSVHWLIISWQTVSNASSSYRGNILSISIPAPSAYQLGLQVAYCKMEVTDIIAVNVNMLIKKWTLHMCHTGGTNKYNCHCNFQSWPDDYSDSLTHL